MVPLNSGLESQEGKKRIRIMLAVAEIKDIASRGTTPCRVTAVTQQSHVRYAQEKSLRTPEALQTPRLNPKSYILKTQE